MIRIFPFSSTYSTSSAAVIAFLSIRLSYFTAVVDAVVVPAAVAAVVVIPPPLPPPPR